MDNLNAGEFDVTEGHREAPPGGDSLCSVPGSGKAEAGCMWPHIARAIGQGVLVTDDEGRIRCANEDAVRILGTDEESLRGEPLKSWCLLEQPDEIDELLDLYRERGDVQSYSDEVMHAGRWVHLRFAPMRLDGEFAGVVLNIRDIHERKATEQRLLRDAAQFESLNREMYEAKDRAEEQAGQLVIALEELKLADERIKEQNARMIKDLDSARRIQRSLLPQEIPQPAGLRFAYRYESCDQVGGDFFDIFELDEKHVALYLADVSGHGVAAAMLAVFAKQVIKGIETSGRGFAMVPPNEVLRRLNDELIRAEFEDMPFLTIFYGILNTETRVLEFAAAAHPAPVVLDGEAGTQIELGVAESSPLGWFGGEEYELRSHQLKPGDRFLLYTDGVTEIFDPEEDLLSPERFQQELLKMAQRSTTEFGDGIVELVHDFTQKDEQDDDITLIIMDCLPAATDQSGEKPDPGSEDTACTESQDTP